MSLGRHSGRQVHAHGQSPGLLQVLQGQGRGLVGSPQVCDQLMYRHLTWQQVGWGTRLVLIYNTFCCFYQQDSLTVMVWRKATKFCHSGIVTSLISKSVKSNVSFIKKTCIFHSLSRPLKWQDIKPTCKTPLKMLSRCGTIVYISITISSSISISILLHF